MTGIEVILGVATIFSANYGSVLLKDYLERRKARKSQNDNMDADYKRQQEVKPLLEDLRYHLKADRVIEVGFSNGDTTLAGYHMKKISIITETDCDHGDEPLAPHFQLIPAKKFDRTLTGLFESDTDWVVWNEMEYRDETAALNRAFELNHLLLTTIRNQDNKWVGYILVSWRQEVRLTESEIGRAQLVASRIGAMSKRN